MQDFCSCKDLLFQEMAEGDKDVKAQIPRTYTVKHC